MPAPRVVPQGDQKKKTILAAAALAVAAPLLFVPNLVRGADAASYSPRGQLVYQIVRKWGPHVQETYRADIDASDDPAAKLKEIEERLNKLRSPFRSAEKFWVEEVIDPRKTRSLLCEFARLAEPIRTVGPATNMAIRP